MKKQHILGCIAVLLALLLPLGFFFGLTASLPQTYHETFVAELSNKFDRLCSIDEPKVVVVGGSSVAFGIDSEAMERELGMPVVNFGLYATLGTKLMLDLSRANIGEGDVVILTPEMDAQTLSLYFNAETTWQALDSDRSMFGYVASEDRASLVGAFYDYSITKLRYRMEGVTLSPAGVYRADSFNAYGDIIYPRPYNIMYESTGIAYDSTNRISLTPDIVDPDFISYVNEYIAFCKDRGASVYFAFCPMNRASLADGTTEDSLVAFYDFLQRSLDCTLLNSPADTAYEENYFYDTNFHLNDAGVTLHTKELLTALYREWSRTELPKLELMERPALPTFLGSNDTAGNEYADCFTFAEYGSGYCVVGTTDRAKTMTSLEVPSSHNGRAVLAIGESVFAGCSQLTTVTLHRTVTVFLDGAFADCPTLTKIYMDIDDAPYMSDPSAAMPRVGNELLRGAAPELRFYFSQAGYELFIGDYSWQNYSASFDIEAS